MSGLAVGLVLIAAFVHATWNLLAKRTGGGAGFVWLISAGSAIVYAPLAAGLVWLWRPHLDPLRLGFMAGTAVLHLSYFLLLQGGYRVGDLSLVYPLARGTGPMLATAAAIAFFGERPSWLGIAGAVCVIAGAGVLATAPAMRKTAARPDPRAVGYGLLTGVLIASYTLWDKYAVSTLLIPPLLLDWGSSLGRALLLAPAAAYRWDEVQLHWRQHRKEVVGVAILGSLSYILVLTALAFTPVSYIAPAREISILIATVMGTRLLAEGHAPWRLAGALAMVVGVIALALG